jgi:tryptophan halogenase
MALFRSNGRVFREHTEMFAEMSWVQVMHGQGIHPRGYHGLVDLLPDDELSAFVGKVRNVIGHCAAQMPTHDAFIDRLVGAAVAN